MTHMAQLEKYIAKLASGGLCVAFSGGVDSAVVLTAARAVCENVHAVMLQTPFHPANEPELAEKTARKTGASFTIIEFDRLPDEIMQNPVDRCYLCKKAIFTEILSYARQSGLQTVLDGTNADDTKEYRPGLKALSELGIKSPLRELGLTKARVREIAAGYGLAVATKPSSPCLATRIPYNTPIEPEVLRKIDEFETYMKLRGFPVVRARIHGDLVRFEVPQAEFEGVLDYREEIIKTAKKLGFKFVTLDLEGFRSGSFDAGL